MTMLYVGGHYIGKLHENPGLLDEYVRAGQRVELRDEEGNQLGRFIPTREPLIPWEPGATREEIDRRLAEPGLTFDEIKTRLGWE